MNELLRVLLVLPEQASSFAGEVDRLHYFVILTTMVVAGTIGLLAMGFALRYRRRGDDEQPADVHPRRGLEVGLIVVTLAFFLTWLNTGYTQFVRMSLPPADALDVYVTGKQWMWEYAYPGGPRSMAVLHVPARRAVRLMMTSRDVIHSFYVPAFRIKQDVLPGRYASQWFLAERPGTYEVFCTELCGTEHSRMRGQVVVLEPADFERWLATGRDGLGALASTAELDPRLVLQTELAAEGARVAAVHGCLRCHSTDGTRHLGPTWRGLYGRARPLGPGGEAPERGRIVADEAYLTRAMMEPRAHVAEGFEPVMPSFQGVLAQGEVAALVEYIRSLGGR